LGFENQANITEYFIGANGLGIFGFPFPAFASSSRLSGKLPALSGLRSQPFLFQETELDSRAAWKPIRLENNRFKPQIRRFKNNSKSANLR